MTPKKTKILKIGVLIAIVGLLIGGGAGLYMFNKPHRDVQSTVADYSMSAQQLVSEYLADATVANDKYLADDGDSKILEVQGIIVKISEDYSGQKVVVLQGVEGKSAVSCTFTQESSASVSSLSVGGEASIKGVIRSGAGYDEDLEMYVNVVLEKSSLVE